MSAFIVDDGHIDALVTFAVRNEVSFLNPETGIRRTVMEGNAEEMGRMLMDQNVRSVGHRYQGRIDQEEKNAAAEYNYKPWPLTQPLSAVQIIVACACYDYQACETDDYEMTAAWRLIAAIRDTACCKLPGWDHAKWTLERPADDGARLLSEL